MKRWHHLFIIFFLTFFSVAKPSHLLAVNLNERAQKLYSELQQDPTNLQKKMDLAYLFTEGLEYGRAIQLYEEVLVVDQTNQRSLNELCYLYTFTRQKQKAYAMCSELTRVAPKKALFFDNLGLSYYKFGDFVAALQAFTKAAELDDRSLLVQNHIGMTLLALKEPSLARDFFEKSLTQKSTSREEEALFYYGLYQAQKEMRDYQKAYDAIAKTYELSQNPLYLGKMIVMFMKIYEVWFFILVSLFILWGCQYLGKRLNRFLKNET